MKQSLRDNILEKRNSLAKKEILEKSNKIKESLFGLDKFKNSRIVMFYVSIKSEVYTHEMVKDSLKQKIVVVPKIVHNEIEPSIIIDFEQMIPCGKYNILEPIEAAKIKLNNIQLVLVPGIVFDKDGYRLGYGLGYYDKFLAKVPKALKIGLAFDFQVVEKIPIEMHDVPVDIVITDKSVIRCK